MKLKAGDRIKALRELMGITREDFADMLELDFIRLRNIEQKRCRMGEEEFAKIGEAFPELLFWLAYEGPIKVQSLKESQQELCQVIAAKINAGQLPKGFVEELSEAIE